MNKIICDICGTDYPELAPQCPICGYANTGGQTLAGNEYELSQKRSKHTYVKGGRFSKANVRKRLQSNHPEEYLDQDEDDEEQDLYEEETQERDLNETEDTDYSDYEDLDDEDLDLDDLDDGDDGDDQPSNRGLIITVVLLLVAIVALSVYLVVWVMGYGLPIGNDKTHAPTVVTTAPIVDTEPVDTAVPCNGLSLSDVDINLTALGGTWQLTATASPENTTDTVVFTSGNEEVVTVNEQGLVTCTGSGITMITVTCGAYKVECPVVCEFPEETEPPEIPEDFELELDKEEFTLLKAGATCEIYSGEVGAQYIKWTSDDEDVATVKNGVVTAVGNGTTTIYGELDGQKVSCEVTCDLPEEETTGTEETTGEDETVEVAGQCKLLVDGHLSPWGDEYNAEVSITVDESFKLTIVDEEHNVVDVEWKHSKEGICEVDGTTVTGTKAGVSTLTATVNGKTFKCIVRVK